MKTQAIKKITVLGFFIMFGLLSLISCGSNEVKNTVTPSANSPALHAVQDLELRRLMDRMDALIQERFMTQPEIDSERQRVTKKMSMAAQSIAQTVEQILMRLPELNLNANEQVVFRTLAAKLEEQAKQLDVLAQNNQIDSIDNAINTMKHTCQSCHNLFRTLRP